MNALDTDLAWLLALLDEIGLELQQHRRTDASVGAENLAASGDACSAERLHAALEAAHPRDGLLSEEATPRGLDGHRVWIVDPIDGTRNYSNGISFWSVSVALFVDGQPELGVVRVPDLSETYWAVRGGGAFCNGVRLTAPPRVEIGPGDLLTVGGLSFPQSFRQGLIRRFGCVSLELCYVAAGRLAGSHVRAPRLWDVAAGLLIASEAGCTIEGDGPRFPPSEGPNEVDSLVAWAPGLGSPREE